MLQRATSIPCPGSEPDGAGATFSPLALSNSFCRRCGGLGVVRVRSRHRTCACVFRAAFRECLASYHHCTASMGSGGGVQYERVGHAQGRCAIIASFKRAEYAADFVLLARRALADRPIEWAVFEAYHVAELEWMDAIPRVNQTLHLARPLNRGNFFHAVYRTEEIIGSTLLRTQPYSLYPPRAYFAGFLIPSISAPTARRFP
jgi:hypothetical protein